MMIWESTIQQELKCLLNNVDPQVPEDDKEKPEKLLVEYSDIFAISNLDLGTTSVVQHKINTGTQNPVRQPLRKPITYVDIIDKQTQAVLEANIIEPVANEWASNVVLVKKRMVLWGFVLTIANSMKKWLKIHMLYWG